MSADRKTSWTTYAVAALASAVIGFGAIYVLLGDGSNGQNTSEVSQEKTATAAPKTSAAPTDGNLSVGAMTTFVFKDEPMDLPEATFNNADGQAISLKSFAGKVVLLNLWATWCAPCRKEMPHLDRLQAELGSDKFEVVAVSIDRGSPEKSRKFLDEIKVKALKLYHDPSAQLGFTLKTIGMPSTLLLDAKGREVGRLVGPAEWDHADAKRLINAQLEKLTN
ncbi:MAG: TlpA family protein disulfide reductase [Hyphomicrobiaceae bacterium]